MNSDQLTVVVIVAIVTSSALFAILIAAWVRVRGLRQTASAATPAIDKRLERMEQAIESVAVEVERISEAQRFTAKLLADRAASAPQQPERVITPR